MRARGSVRYPSDGETLRTQVIDTFLGIDYTNDAGNVDVRQSPDAPNMIRDVPGKVRKCMGYERMADYGAAINGAHHLRTGEGSWWLLHAGTGLYDQSTGVKVVEGLADNRSRSVQLGEAVWLLDGAKLWKIWRRDGQLSAAPADEDAYIPTLTISKEPGGGGVAYEDLNLLQPKFTELFFGDGESKEYHLSFAALDSDEVEVQVMDIDTAEWSVLTPGTDYKVDAESGVVTFTTAPAAGVGGEDNVSITASKTFSGYAERIWGCDICTLYGVNGQPDRLFVSGNPNYPNRDWHSGQGDPTYWPDTGYSILGSERSAVMGYAILGNSLAAYKDSAEPERAVILRTGTLNAEGEPVFTLVGALAGPGIVSKNSTAYLENEPLALTGQGVYALTASDVTGERYSQNRSFYADGGLLKLGNLSEATAVVYDHMYWLCNGVEAYLLDGMQTMTDRGKPYSTRLYAAWHRTNLPARVLWVDGDALWFGSAEGVVYRFYRDPESGGSYNDDGAPVGGRTGCYWSTPELSGNVFYRTKYFKWIALQLRAGLSAKVDLYAMRDGLWELVRSIGAELKYWSWEDFDWEKFTWSSNQENHTLSSRTRLRRIARTRYKIENSNADEPLGLMAIGLDYTELGRRYKR